MTFPGFFYIERCIKYEAFALFCLLVAQLLKSSAFTHPRRLFLNHFYVILRSASIRCIENYSMIAIWCQEAALTPNLLKLQCVHQATALLYF